MAAQSHGSFQTDAFFCLVFASSSSILLLLILGFVASQEKIHVLFPVFDRRKVCSETHAVCGFPVFGVLLLAAI
jgi:hypothetical protein